MQRISLNNDQDFLVWREGSGNTVEIFELAVYTARREGIGTKLIKQLVADVPKDCHLVWAMTRKANKIAQEFYVAVGFCAVAILPRFYGEGDDAVIYGLDLPRRSERC